MYNINMISAEFGTQKY